MSKETYNSTELKHVTSLDRLPKDRHLKNLLNLCIDKNSAVNSYQKIRDKNYNKTIDVDTKKYNTREEKAKKFLDVKTSTRIEFRNMI